MLLFFIAIMDAQSTRGCRVGDRLWKSNNYFETYGQLQSGGQVGFKERKNSEDARFLVNYEAERLDEVDVDRSNQLFLNRASICLDKKIGQCACCF